MCRRWVSFARIEFGSLRTYTIISICCCPIHTITAVLKPGIVTVYEAEGTVKQVFVSSGTITVNEDSTVQVLAEEAHAIEDLDRRAAEETLQKAQAQLSGAKDDQERAEATIAVEVAELVVQAAK